MLHIARSENLHSEHNRWQGEEIFARFEKDAQHFLYYLTLDTRRDRPAPQFDPQEMFPNHRMTTREATYYYSRAALAVLVSLGGPGQLDRIEVELIESPAAPANDTRVCSIGDFLAWTAPSSPTSLTWWNTSAGVR